MKLLNGYGNEAVLGIRFFALERVPNFGLSICQAMTPLNIRSLKVTNDHNVPFQFIAKNNRNAVFRFVIQKIWLSRVFVVRVKIVV